MSLHKSADESPDYFAEWLRCARERNELRARLLALRRATEEFLELRAVEARLQNILRDRNCP